VKLILISPIKEIFFGNYKEKFEGFDEKLDIQREKADWKWRFNCAFLSKLKSFKFIRNKEK